MGRVGGCAVEPTLEAREEFRMLEEEGQVLESKMENLKNRITELKNDKEREVK